MGGWKQLFKCRSCKMKRKHIECCETDISLCVECCMDNCEDSIMHNRGINLVEVYTKELNNE